MAEQRHRIKRQILELSIPGKQAAPVFYADVRRLYDQEIAPLIERCLSEFSRPDQIHRINRLELDLGSLDATHFEADLVAKIEVQLRQKLRDCLEPEVRQAADLTQNAKTAHTTQATKAAQAAEVPPKKQIFGNRDTSAISSQVELLAFFAQRGALPWWADASKRTVLEAAVEGLQKNAPDVLQQLMETLSRETPALQRWVRHFDDIVLTGLCQMAQPLQSSDTGSFVRTHQGLLTCLKASPLLPKLTAIKCRHLLWEEIFRVCYAVQSSDRPAHLFWKDVLKRFAGHFQYSLKTLLDALRQGLLSSKPQVDSTLIKLFESLMVEQRFSEKSALGSQKKQDSKNTEAQSKPLEAASLGHAKHALPEVSDDVIEKTPEISPSQYPLIVRHLSVLKQSGGFFEPLFAPFRVLLDRLPPSLFQTFLSTLTSLNPAKIGIPSEDQKMKEMLRAMLLTVLSEEGSLERPIKACLLALVDHQNPKSLDFEGLDAEERYVENAGLVILWPFLIHFFKHMDLMDKQGFKDRKSLHRAVLLLQHLVTEDRRPAEYHLTLNRVLCGMDLETVIEQEEPISEEETAECEALLEAVIAQVPILKKMSPQGFRGTFLIRKGVLSTRDGMWLLRVNRNDFDVVLDHFPWNIGWIKLSTMSQAMQVEW